MRETLDILYRPSTYEEVVGQEGAIAAVKGELVRSYIFTGPSGVGKSTLGRIFAKSNEAEVLELDTASLGKADIETLKESAYYKPMFNTTKVIILDEVHNLSKQGWDSLLKVIEEGPLFLSWVLITTEIAKVPNTIATRSRMVQFKSVSINQIKERLLEITEKEGREVPDETIHNIAAGSAGSVREAVKTLETYLNTGDVTVRDYQRDAIKLVKAVYEKDYDTIVAMTEDFTMKDVEMLVRVVTEFITMLMLISISKERGSPTNDVGRNILADRTDLNPDLVVELRELWAVILGNFSMIGDRHVGIAVDTLYGLINEVIKNYTKFQDVRITVRGALLWYSEQL